MSVKLTAKWQLDAALLSRPVDLTALVSMSRSAPDKFLEDNTLHRLITQLLNEKNKAKSDKDTKLDVLNIMANVAASKSAVSEVRVALQGVSEWFDEYMAAEEADPGQEPELHKAMVLLLARCWDYKLKTEDVLELTQGNRRISLCTVVGLLEDGETYSTELKQRQKPGQGRMGQWEHELVCERYEKPLLLQICRLLRGFTHPGTYFESSTSEIALFSVERFAMEMDTLLEITLRSMLVEKLSAAMYDCLFEEEEARLVAEGGSGDEEKESERCALLEETDHLAVTSLHTFLQNLYLYATSNTDEFRRHMLVETLLIPRLVLPYLDRCVLHVMILNNRAEAYAEMLEGDQVAQLALHNPNLVKGIAASLRTVIVASFRAPATQFVMTLLRKFNPTAQMLRARAFCVHHEYIFALLCLLNVNMGALDLSRPPAPDPREEEEDGYSAHALLYELAALHSLMDREKQARVYKRVMCSGALPIARDTPSYAAVMSVLLGGAGGQLEYTALTARGRRGSGAGDAAGEEDGEGDVAWDSRAEAKRAHADRMSALKMVEELAAEAAAVANARRKEAGAGAGADEKQSQMSAFEVAVAVANAAETKIQEAKSSGGGGGGGGDEKKGGGAGGGAVAAASASAAGPPPTASSGPSKSLLGDLPSLNPSKGRGAQKESVRIALSLELPDTATKQSSKFMSGSAAPKSAPTPAPTPADSNIPKEFLCAINGHAMKDPVRSTSGSGLVFERATIELWIATRGSVCPISHSPLGRDQLMPADDLRNRIKRYHIEQLTRRTASLPDDDLYDF